jgi:hypothetical protein
MLFASMYSTVKSIQVAASMQLHVSSRRLHVHAAVPQSELLLSFESMRTRSDCMQVGDLLRQGALTLDFSSSEAPWRTHLRCS